MRILSAIFEGLRIVKTFFCDKEFLYDGTQLSPLFAYMNFNLLGDSIVSWVGPCNIPFAHMVDGEDLLAKSEIRGAKMAHFIVEKFDVTLFSGVALQRLLASLIIDELRMHSPVKQMAQALTRDGDDIYYLRQKLSISIATQSVTSTLVHFAVNVSNDGTPVSTLSLQDLQVEPLIFCKNILAKFASEVASITEATQKVKSV